jgi:hypothetical protein
MYPPALKLWTKKFLSISLGTGVGAGVLVLAAGGALAVVVAGDMAVSGVTPAAGDMAMAGLIIVAGAVAAAAAGLAGAVTGGGGGGWPKELKTRVTEQRLAISSVFIGLIGKFLSRLEFR